MQNSYFNTPEAMAAALHSIASELDYFDNEEAGQLDSLTEAIRALIDNENRDLIALCSTLDYIAENY